VGSARRHALCRHERVRDARTTREPSCSRHGAYTPTRFFGRYFLWDSIVSLVHYEGMGFVIHGARLMSLGSSGHKTDGNMCRVGLLDHLSQCLCEVSFTPLSRSTMLSASRALHRGPSSLIMARVLSFGSCTWLCPGFYRILFGALDHRSTPFLNIHW
jgi:hypothetical protein